MIYGLMCIRILSVSEYTKYVVVFTVQATVTVLMDSGITGTIIPLVGEKSDDTQLIADYVASLRGLAHILYFIVGIVLFVAFPHVAKARGWDFITEVQIIAVLLGLTWFSRVTSAYGSVLIIRKDRNYWYRTQIYSSVFMLIMLLLAYAAGIMTAICAMMINLCGVMYIAWRYYLRSKELLQVKGKKDWRKQKSILQLASPSIPGVMFYSFQGQIGTYTLTFIGRPESVASIGALGKVCQMFNFLTPMNPVLVEPYFAKIRKDKLKANAAVALSVVTLSAILLLLTIKIVPHVFLWVLGPRYHNLTYEIFLAVVPGVMSLVGGMVASINAARRFNYYSFNIANIVFSVAVQAICMMKMNLGNLQAVLMFNILTGCPGFFLVVMNLLYGFKKGGRVVADDYELA
jgi:hypothetical protein